MSKGLHPPVLAQGWVIDRWADCGSAKHEAIRVTRSVDFRNAPFVLTQEWENYQKGGQYEKNMETANKYFNVFNNGIRKQCGNDSDGLC